MKKKPAKKRRETKKQRSAIMARVKSKHTKPELKVRKIARELGAKYRLHAGHLPGKPDLVFPAQKTALFVHGCFWHGHDCKRGRNRPASNLAYWNAKLARNMARDSANLKLLRKAGWRVMVVWECEMRDEVKLRRRLANFLKIPKTKGERK